MAFLEIDERKKVKSTVVGALIIAAILGVYPIITGFIKSTDDGREALKGVKALEVRQDTMEIRCARKNFEDALFKQEIRQKLEHYDEGQQEIKGDLKWIRENLDKKH